MSGELEIGVVTMGDVKRTYPVKMLCNNCGHLFTKDMPVGTPCVGAQECGNCECKEAYSLVGRSLTLTGGA